MKIKLIIFDLDGTLVDSLDDLTEAVNQVRAGFALPLLARGHVQGMVGKGARTLIERALPGMAVADLDRALAQFLAYNEAHIADHTTCYPGVPELLAMLSTSGVQLVVVSNKNASLCRQLLEKLHVAGHFAAIYGADSFVERKPSPLPLLEAIRLAGVTVDETVVVGDSENDVLAACAAGVPVIGCSYGYGSARELAAATAIAASPSDLLAMLQQMDMTKCGQ